MEDQIKRFFRTFFSCLDEILGRKIVKRRALDICKLSLCTLRKRVWSKGKSLGIPASTDNQIEHWQLSATDWILLSKKLIVYLEDLLILENARVLIVTTHVRFS